VRQAFTRKHAGNQLRYLWRPVIILTLILLTVGCQQASEPSSDLTNQRKVKASTSIIKVELQAQESQVATANIPTEVPTPPQVIVVVTPDVPAPEPTQVELLPPSPVPEVSAASVSAATVVGKITGYYCSQVAGYPIWDGVGYCKTMSSGQSVYAGAAACGAKWQLGQRLEVSGYGLVTCEDRGILEFTQVDIFFTTNESLYKSGISNRRTQITEVP